MELTLAVIAVLVGPAGIVVGWWLNERSEERRYKRNAEQARRDAEEVRLIAVTRQTRKVAGELRGMAGGIYALKSRGHSMTDQMKDAMDQFNALWRELEAMAAEFEVLGDQWLADDVEPVMNAGRDMMETMQRMQVRMTNEDIVLVQEQLKTVDEAVASMTKHIRDHVASRQAKAQ